jgi:hypothetical protein
MLGAAAISALHKYGLLEKQGDDIKVSERALRILHPQSPEERGEAIREAAGAPQLFAELAERFPGRVPNEELLRNYLVRNGFVPAAAQLVVLSYRETSELVAREAGGHDSGAERTPEVPMQSMSAVRSEPHLIKKTITHQMDERELCPYNFEGGGYVKVVVGGGIDTEAALDMIEIQIKLKRAELKAKTKTSASPEPAVELDKDSEG